MKAGRDKVPKVAQKMSHFLFLSSWTNMERILGEAFTDFRNNDLSVPTAKEQMSKLQNSIN